MASRKTWAAALAVAHAALLAWVEPASAETMLEWAKARGAASAEKFEDDIGTAIERPLPIMTRLETWGTAGLGVSEMRASTGRRHDQALDAWLGIDVALVGRSFLPRALTWGRTWLLTSRLGAGGSAQGALGQAGIEAGIGPFWALSCAGEGLFARLSLGVTEELDGPWELFGYGLGLPIGFTSAWAEFGVRPELGSLKLMDSAAGGPWLLGAYGRTLGDRWRLELEHTRAVSSSHVDTTRVAACARLGWLSLCTEGWAVSARDPRHRAQWGRAGLRVGLAWGSVRQERSEAPTSPVVSTR